MIQERASRVFGVNKAAEDVSVRGKLLQVGAAEEHSHTSHWHTHRAVATKSPTNAARPAAGKARHKAPSPTLHSQSSPPGSHSLRRVAVSTCCNPALAACRCSHCCLASDDRPETRRDWASNRHPCAYNRRVYLSRELLAHGQATGDAAEPLEHLLHVCSMAFPLWHCPSRRRVVLQGYR